MAVAVILAAGRGSRLHSISKHSPKPLTKILEKPIIEYTIQALKSAGVKNIVIVTGYLDKHIKKYLGSGERLGVKIQYRYNRRYMFGNAVSLKTARTVFRKSQQFLLLMGDHYFEKAIIERAVKNSIRQPLLCIDKNPRYPPQIRDATKVLVDEYGYVVDIGKNVQAWNAVDVGLFLLDGAIFEVINSLEKQKPFLDVAECIRYLSLNVKPVWGCDVSGHFWFDIDTPLDVEFVENLLRGASMCQRTGME
ncbi:MAG: sugar phosphate nucleotidyltransferase [Candidatus Bathyarchaeia archaeon]